MEVLRIISESWPLAIMFIAVCVAGVILYLINWFKRSDLEDKAIRASQALVVRSREDH
jgi:predicted membrane-bound mannosyltransferase